MKIKRLFFSLLATLLLAVPVHAAQYYGRLNGWDIRSSCTAYVSTGVGCYDSTTKTFCIGNGTSCVVQGGGSFISDTAYDATTWDNVTTIAPSKNAVRDKFETLPSTYLPFTGGTLLGNLLFTDNLYDIGASGATRPRTGYFGTSLYTPELYLTGATPTYIPLTGTGGLLGNSIITQPSASSVNIVGDLSLSNVNVTHGLTNIVPTNVFGTLTQLSGTTGGVILRGISDTDAVALYIVGVLGSTNPASSAIVLQAMKSNGTTGGTILSDTDTVLKINNLNTNLVTVLGSGNILTGGITAAGTSAAKVLGMGSGTAPTTSPADMSQMWSADYNGVAGTARLHERTESGISSPIALQTEVDASINPKATAQSVNMTAAASGSSGIMVADNDNINFGTGNFTLVWRGSLPDWTPSSVQNIFYKDPGATGYAMTIGTSGAISIYFASDYRLITINPGFIDGTVHDIALVVTRETASSSGTVLGYVDGNQVVASAGGTIAQGSPANINSSAPTYLLGTDSVRTSGTTSHAYTYNRALTATEVLDLYRNGVATKHRKAGQTALTSGTVVIGQEYTIDTFVAGDDFVNIGGTNVTGNVFVATGATPTTWTNSSSLRATGGTLILEPSGIKTPKWFDSGINSLDASYPTAGSSLTVPYQFGTESLLSITNVSLAADADTTIYTVPTGRRLVLTKAILIVGADAGTTVISIGADTAETNWLPNNTLSALDAANDVGVLMPVPSATTVLGKSYAAGTVIQAKVSSQAGGATNALHLFGFLY